MKHKFLLVLSLVSFLPLTTISSCQIVEEPSEFEKETKEIYELAKVNGYEGTYEEWLESIKGKDGVSITNIDSKVSDDNYLIITITLSNGNNKEIKIKLVEGPKGDKGETGISITGITKTSSNGNVDTYTITYSDGTTTTFTVTNGTNGEQGIKGEPGKDGHTPVITIGENGNWFIDDQDTNIKAQGIQGPKGDKGNDGKDGSSFLVGENDPSDDLGNNDDVYLNNVSYDLFKKENGKWVKIGNIKGKDSESSSTTYTVNLDLNGGKLVDESIPLTYKVNKGDSIILPIVTKDGYNFDGWFTGDTINDTKWTNYLPVTSNLDLKANFSILNRKISIDLQGKNVVLEVNNDQTLLDINSTLCDYLGYSSNDNIIQVNVILDETNYTLFPNLTFKEIFEIYGDNITFSAYNGIYKEDQTSLTYFIKDCIKSYFTKMYNKPSSEGSVYLEDILNQEDLNKYNSLTIDTNDINSSFINALKLAKELANNYHYDPYNEFNNFIDSTISGQYSGYLTYQKDGNEVKVEMNKLYTTDSYNELIKELDAYKKKVKDEKLDVTGDNKYNLGTEAIILSYKTLKLDKTNTFSFYEYAKAMYKDCVDSINEFNSSFNLANYDEASFISDLDKANLKDYTASEYLGYYLLKPMFVTQVLNQAGNFTTIINYLKDTYKVNLVSNTYGKDSKTLANKLLTTTDLNELITSYGDYKFQIVYQSLYYISEIINTYKKVEDLSIKEVQDNFYNKFGDLTTYLANFNNYDLEDAQYVSEITNESYKISNGYNEIERNYFTISEATNNNMNSYVSSYLSSYSSFDISVFNDSGIDEIFANTNKVLANMDISKNDDELYVFNNETYGYYMLSIYFYLVFSFISQLNDQSVSTELINSTSIISSIYQINDMIHNNQLSEEYNRQTIENQFSNDYTTLENLVKKFNA